MPYLQGPMWHAHEMLFGFTLAVIVGFLFTAGRNWTNRPTPTGAPLAALALLWVAARVLVLTPYGWAAAAANVAFPLAAAVALARPFVAARNRRNYFFVGLLLLLAAAALWVHLQWLGVLAVPAWAGIQLALDVVLFVMAVMAGRVVPMFTNNGVPGARATRHAALEKLALGAVLLLLAADLLQLPAPLLAGIALLGAVAHLARWLLWQPWTTLRAPIVWVLHAAYLWIPVHLALRAAAALGWAPSVAGIACVDGRRRGRPDHRHDDAHRAWPHRAAAARRPCRRGVLWPGAGRRAGAGARALGRARLDRRRGAAVRRRVVRGLRPVRAALLAGADTRAPGRQTGLTLGLRRLKLLHQGTVLLSLAGFVARGLGSFSGAAWVRGRLRQDLAACGGHGAAAVGAGHGLDAAPDAGFGAMARRQDRRAAAVHRLGAAGAAPGAAAGLAHRRLGGGTAVLRLDRVGGPEQEPARRLARARRMTRRLGLGCSHERDRQWNLGMKLALVATPFLILTLLAITATLWVSWQLEGGAAAVNEAGRMRMQTYRLSLSLATADEPSLRQQVAGFEDSLALLRGGDPERPLFVPWDDTVRARFATVEQDWATFKRHWAGAAKVDVAELRAQAAGFVTHIDALVDGIEAHMSRWTALQHLLQTAVLALAVAGGATLLLTGYRFVLEPVSQLKRAIERLQGGDFSARVSGSSNDEFGTLAAGFNELAEHLQSMYRNLEAKVAEKTSELQEKGERLQALYDMSTLIARATTLDELASGFTQRIARVAHADARGVALVRRKQPALPVAGQPGPADGHGRGGAMPDGG